MTKADIKQFRSILQNRQRESSQGVQSREELEIESSPDELDRIQSASDRAYAIGNMERRSNQMRQIQAALRRVDAGSYGLCAACEEEIPSKRLVAVPWAEFCIACQEAEDRMLTTQGKDDEMTRSEAA